jgi:hypothetical protein
MAFRSRQAALPLASRNCRNSAWDRGEESCNSGDGFLEWISARRSGRAGNVEKGVGTRNTGEQMGWAARPGSGSCRQFMKMRYHLAGRGISGKDLPVWDPMVPVAAGRS